MHLDDAKRLVREVYDRMRPGPEPETVSAWGDLPYGGDIFLKSHGRWLHVNIVRRTGESRDQEEVLARFCRYSVPELIDIIAGIVVAMRPTGATAIVEEAIHSEDD